MLFLCGFSIKKQVSPTYGEAMQPWLGALTIGTACSLQPVGPASGIPIICWPLSCVDFLLKGLHPSSPFVQPYPIPKPQLIGPEVGIGRTQPISSFL